MKKEQRDARKRAIIEGINQGTPLRVLMERYGVTKAQALRWIQQAKRRPLPVPKASIPRKPKVLIYDIETLPNMGYFFETKSDFGIPLDFIQKPKSIITIAFKWLGEDGTTVFVGKPYNDKELLETFLPIWDSADYVVAHNGDNFDAKMIAARLMANGLASSAPVTQLDTYKLARSKFGRHLNSNKLDHLAAILGVSRKTKTDASLWVKCAQGDKDAIRKMAEYNKQDVLVLEEVFVKLLPYVQSKLNWNLFVETPVQHCKQCGSDEIDFMGYHYTAEALRHRYNCGGCGSWSVFKKKPAPPEKGTMRVNLPAGRFQKAGILRACREGGNTPARPGKAQSRGGSAILPTNSPTQPSR